MQYLDTSLATDTFGWSSPDILWVIPQVARLKGDLVGDRSIEEIQHLRYSQVRLGKQGEVGHL